MFLLKLSLIFFLTSSLQAHVNNNTEHIKLSNQKILIISDTWHQIGGAEIVLDQITQELTHKGHHVEQLTLDDVATFKIPWPNVRVAYPFGLEKKINQKIDVFKPDAILIFLLGVLSYMAGRYCEKKEIPFNVFYPSNIPAICKATLGLPLFISYFFVKRFLLPAAKIFVPTQSIKNELKLHGIQDILVWQHGIDFNQFTLPTLRQKDRARLHLGLTPGQHPIYLYVGRLSRAKNIQSFLDAPLSGKKILVGPEDYGYTISSLQKQYPGVIFAGPQRGLSLLRYYHAADIFIFPSKTDTFGLVLLEALATGIPVIAFNAPGPADITPESSGVSFLANTDTEFVDKAIGASKQIEIKLITPQKCRAYAKQFSWKQATDMLIKNLTLIHP